MILIILLAGLAALSLTLTAGVTATVFFHLRHRAGEEHASGGYGHEHRGPWPAITVLKPLKGVDEGLYENLASLARQDYPRVELVFGTAEDDDPALDGVERLRRNFPHVSITVVAGSGPLGLNPKVSNLAAMAPRASYDWWLISDSDVRAEPDYLRTLARETSDPGVGLVTSAFTGVGGVGAKVLLDALQLRRLGGHWPRLHHLAWIPVKDGLIATLWLVGLFRRNLDWRGNRLRVAAGSELEAPAEGAPAWVEELLAASPPTIGKVRKLA